MIQRVLCLLVLCTTAAAAAEQDSPKVNESSMRVDCQGKLRHGLAAIGGETTGTTITFDGATWELNLPNSESRSLAEKLNKKSVAVVGTLRHVRGIEIPSRWIVDVEKLAASDIEIKGNTKNEWAKVSVTGTIKRHSNQGDTTDSSATTTVTSDEVVWRLDFSDNRELDAKSKPFDGQLVTVKGLFVRGEAPKSEGPMNLKVSSIALAAKR